MKILIIRNDKIGDFVLSLPVFSLIRQYLTDAEVHALVPEYTSEIAKLDKNINNIIIDPGAAAPYSEQLKLLRKIKKEKYDAVITLFSTTRVGMLLALSGIKYRLAPATKLAQIFYNHKLTQRRSRSLKPEYQYNLDLAIKFLSDYGITVNKLPKGPYLQFDKSIAEVHRENFCANYNLNPVRKIIFIHPNTGGSATNLNIEQYSNLVKNIRRNNEYNIVITAGPDEKEYAQGLSDLLNDVPHVIYHSTDGLSDFIKTIQICDIFISASTGPLHIAGALNRPTAAFYQRRRSATSLRWQTLNSKERRLAFSPPETAHESDMQEIDINDAANKIISAYLSS